MVDGVDEVFPLGRARESEAALRRANLVLEKRLEVRGWHPPLPEGAARIGAFCAIGDPESFRRTVAAAGVAPVEWWEYPDHHVYTEPETAENVHRRGCIGNHRKGLCKTAGRLSSPLSGRGI